jgi:hypothetical protein
VCADAAVTAVGAGLQATIFDAIEAGKRGMARSYEAAERKVPDFGAKAEAAMVDFLARQPNRRAAGEDITEAVCRAIGCHGRQLGAIYKRLIGRRLQVTRSDLPRRHGHASVGGKEYELIA